MEQHSGGDKVNVAVIGGGVACIVAMQAGLSTLNRVQNRWFCGGYFGYSFHGDAVRSSYQAAARLRIAAL